MLPEYRFQCELCDAAGVSPGYRRRYIVSARVRKPFYGQSIAVRVAFVTPFIHGARSNNPLCRDFLSLRRPIVCFTIRVQPTCCGRNGGGFIASKSTRWTGCKRIIDGCFIDWLEKATANTAANTALAKKSDTDSLHQLPRSTKKADVRT